MKLNFSLRSGRFFAAAFLTLFFSSAALAQLGVPESGRTSEHNSARNRAQIHAELAALYYQSENYDVALEEANAAIAADASFASALGMRGLIYASLGDQNAADSDFRRALSMESNDPNLNNNYGWFLCQQNDPAQQKAALPYFFHAIQHPLYTTPETAYTNAGLCALKQGERDAAREYFLKAIQASRGGALQAQVYLARISYMDGNLVETRNRLQDVLQSGETPSPETLWLAIRVEHKLGNHDEKQSLITQLRRLYPASPEYQEYLKGTYE